MPQYVSLAQQGFWQPYQALGDAAARYSDRQTHKQERQQDVDWRSLRRGDELAQQGQENTRANALSKLNLDTGNFNLSQEQKKAGQSDALTNFDVNAMAGGEKLPAGTYGPPKPLALDLSVPFALQPPEVQQNTIRYAHENKVPIQSLAAQFQQQQTALTGLSPAPILPRGMSLTKYSVGKDGPEFEAHRDFGAQTGASGVPAGLPKLPPGYTYVPNPSTGEWEAKKAEVLGEQEAQRLQSLDTLEQQMTMLKQNLNELPRGSWVPGYGWLARHWPTALGGSAVPNAADANVAAMGPDIYRGLLNQHGMFTEHAKSEVDPMIPKPTDSPAVRKIKMQQLDHQLGEARNSTLSTLSKAGRDVSAFGPVDLGQHVQLQAPGRPKFNSVAEAQKASLAPGTEVEVLDPSSGQYLVLRKK